jgi:hypothetical protein
MSSVLNQGQIFLPEPLFPWGIIWHKICYKTLWEGEENEKVSHIFNGTGFFLASHSLCRG